jgi:hypothetical protein
MKTKDRARRGVKASPWATPMKKLMVGVRNIMKPMADSGARRVAQENSTRAPAVTKPQVIAAATVSGLANPWPWPVCWSQAM